MNKMVMAVVQRNLAASILRGLLDAGFTATITESKGGILRQSQNALFIAVNEDRLPEVVSVIKETCPKKDQLMDKAESEQSMRFSADEIRAGNAVIFVWDLTQIERY